MTAAVPVLADTGPADSGPAGDDCPESLFDGPGGEVRRWQALALLFLTQMLAIGSISYGFAVLLKPLAADFGLDRVTVNRGLMTVLVGMAVFAPLVGRALDRFSGRLVVMAGTGLFAAGWVGITLSTNVVSALLCAFFLLSPGAAAMGPVAVSTLVSRWFTQRRGLALGISSVAMSTGGVVVVPLLAYLIEGNGWRNAMSLYGLAGSGLILLLAMLVLPKERPPRSDVRGQASAVVSDETALWRMLDFWLIVGAVGILMGTNGALLSCLVAYATDRGFSVAEGAALISVISGGAVMGKLLLGALSDRVDPRWLFLVVVALNVLLLGTLLAGPSYSLLFLTALLSGPAVGGAVPLWTVIVGRRFGLARMGRAMGLTSAAMLPLTLGSLHLVGALYDASGSYQSAFQLFLAMVVMAGILVLPIRGVSRPLTTNAEA